VVIVAIAAVRCIGCSRHPDLVRHLGIVTAPP